MIDRAKLLARHSRYNTSPKGQARNKAYEERHPERADRLRTGMIARDVIRATASAERAH
jgi:hypothetical protein